MRINYELGLRLQFRYYSRCVCYSPSNAYFHKKRLQIASKFEQDEPLQGAMADYFFAHWYNMASEGVVVLDNFESGLPSSVIEAFRAYINQGIHLPAISSLATRYSVLVSPSMNVPVHKLYVGKDDAKQIADSITKTLVDAKNQGDYTTMVRTEEEYLAHCLACQDRIGFMMTWFALSKHDWYFDEKWEMCKAKLAKV